MMKKLLHNSVFRILIVLAGNFCLFYFLLTYIIPYRLTTPLTIGLTTGLFVIFALVFSSTMLCELCYDEASRHLVIYGDLKKAFLWMKRMKRLDILHWYRSQYAVFMSVYYEDTDDVEGLRTVLQDRIFQSNESMKLVYHYGLLQVAIRERDDESLNQHYHAIETTYQRVHREKDRSTALIYDLRMIQAEYELYYRHMSSANQHLNRVRLEHLNKREQSHYYYLKYRSEMLGKQKKRAQHFYELALKQYPQGQFIKVLTHY